MIISLIVNKDLVFQNVKCIIVLNELFITGDAIKLRGIRLQEYFQIYLFIYL